VRPPKRPSVERFHRPVTKRSRAFRQRDQSQVSTHILRANKGSSQKGGGTAGARNMFSANAYLRCRHKPMGKMVLLEIWHFGLAGLKD
jgi:hypothetical protein